ncbi:MAG: KpsF/GutQ family sugar-phosphate isomerase [Rickettsiales bacterium]|nr:KpsF/GutQ family sugar-phosphate isomerase [Rickettsiales bacterium]
MEKRQSLPSNDDLALASGHRTLEQEIAGLKAVSEALDARFTQAVQLIAGLKGRLIVTGMGKSGHVARKIAATMASTGTPAYFVHPSEASHGDLGMITPDDALMMLSNSGETSELGDMISYAKRYAIPIIALVRRDTSMLVEAANVAVVLPEIPEASPTGAPTTSTIMMMAYGDALAMALLDQRGFTKDDFRVYHPGGKLGKNLLRVADLMHAESTLPLVAPTDIMRDVLLTITRHAMGCAGVCEEGKLIGIITDGDLRRHMQPDLLAQCARDVMTPHPVTVTAKMLAVEAIAIMNSKSITCVFALDAEGVPTGLLHLHDCLRAGVV